MNLKFSLSLLGAVLLSIGVKAAPTITSFTPNYGASNDPDFIYINGSGFLAGSVVLKFNGTTASTASAIAADQIQAHVANGTPRGTAYVYLTVNGQQAPTNNGVVFTVIGPSDPYISAFSPPTGIPGSTSVTVTGVHFAVGMTIKFNGTAASGFTVTDPNEVTVTVPASATTGAITVGLAGAGTNSSAANFFIAPNITSFSPSSGRTGTNVVIRGSSFSNAFAVKFGTLNAASFVVDSNSQITAVAPNGVLTGQITVTAPGGTYITSTNFTVVPTLSNFTPAFGPPGTPVTISGANLNAGGLTVTFNGGAASVGAPSFNSVAVTAPSSTTGPLVLTTVGGSATSSASFYYSAAVTSLIPTNSAPGTTVKITGNNFTGATAVNFTGGAATSFVVSNNTTIGAVVPAGVTTGPVSVTTPAGTVNSVGLFYAAPAITSFNPTHGAPGSSVMISGNNFLGTTAVLFNGTNAAFTVTNNSVIGALVPNNALSGPITVIAPAGTNTSAATFTLDYTNDVSVFITNAPGPVFVTSNLVYTITVANYTGPFQALNVKFTNTLPASVTLKSATTTQGTLNTNATPITAALGTIPVGNSAIITLTVVPQTVGTITDSASAGGDDSDSNPANNSASNVTTVWPLPFLGIQTLTSNQIKVFWPAPLSNFTLLYKSNLVPLTATWSTDLTARVLSGTNISVTETNTGTTKFFRLKQ